MKKVLLVISLIAFLGMYILPSYSVASEVNTVVVDNHKCDKCGKEECKGNCEAKAAKCKHATKDGDAKKCCDKSKSASCCKSKAKSAEGSKCSHAKPAEHKCNHAKPEEKKAE